MLLSYLKLSLRLLARNPFFTFVNVVGLSVGFSVFIYLWQYSRNEMQSDRMWKDWERIARVGIHIQPSTRGTVFGDVLSGMIPACIVPQMRQDFIDIEEFTRCSVQLDRLLLSTMHNGQKVTFKEEYSVFLDANFFDFFDVPFAYGSPQKALADGNTICISRSLALKYFGERNPLGEILILNDTLPLKVGGVFYEFPTNSNFSSYFKVALSNEKLLPEWTEVSSVTFTESYIKTKSNNKWADFENKVNGFREKYWAEFMKQFPQSKPERMLIQPLPDIMFNSSIDHVTPSEQKSKGTLVIFGILGFVILVIAWINYIILALSRANKRMKEVATRKVAGASSKDFVWQFVIEALVLNVISLVLGFTLLQFVSRSANILFNMQYYGFTSTDEWSLLIVFSIFLAGIFITGGYPALIAARYHPRAIFNLGTGLSRRSGMIVFLTTVQYGSAVILIVAVFIISLQINHVISKSRSDAGEYVIVIDSPIIESPTHQTDMEYFANQLGVLSGVSSNAMSRRVAGESADMDAVTVFPSGPEDRFGLVSNGGVDENFIPLFNIKVLAGRNFVSTDRGSVIILSETAIRNMGFNSPSEAIGAMVKVESYGPNLVDMEIIGVVNDYQNDAYLVNNAKMEANPGLGLTYKGHLAEHHFPQRVIIKVDPQKAEEVIAEARKDFDSIFPGNVFNWYWLDEQMERKYDQEKATRNQITFFTSIAIGIACLGLLGMMSHTAVEKTKEIGIRKILGAELSQIAQLLLNTTLKQIAVATLIVIPLAYYLAQQYLEKYSERITLQWWHFALPLLILVVIMLVTIASVLWKAAKSNPVEALKYE